MKLPAKDRILDKADALFSAKGYGNVGINEIIAESGTAKASFYQHFPSKERLCEAWLSMRHARSAVEWAGLVEQSGGAEKKIIAVFDGLAAFMQQSNFRGCPFTNTGGFIGDASAPVRAQIVHHKNTQRAFFIQLAIGLTSAAKAQKLGSALFLLYSGATMEAQNAQDTWPVEVAKTAAKALISLYRKPA